MGQQQHPPRTVQRSVATERTNRARAGDDGDASRGRRVVGLVRRWLASADWSASLLLALLAASILWLNFVPTTQRTVWLAEAPEGFALEGFYGPEHNGSFSFRWSQPRATMTLPVPPADGYTITLTLQDGPGGTAPRWLNVLVNGSRVATLYPDSTLREYHLSYTRPGDSTAIEETDEPLRVALLTEPRRAEGDPRELGFVVATARWEIAGHPPAWQWGLFIAQVGLLVLGYGLLGALRHPRNGTPLLIGYGAMAITYWLIASLHPAMMLSLAALGLLFVARRSPSPRLAPLGEAAGQRWLALLAILGVGASTPLALAPHDPNLWLPGYVALLLAGVATVQWLRERRPELALGGYALATALAAVWWHWLVAARLGAIPDLQPYDQTAIRLVPWVLIACGAAGYLLARLLPPATGHWLLVGNLLAGLIALALPTAIWLVGQGEYSILERTLRVSWPGGVLVLLLVAKVAILGVALWRGAPGVATERRMTLAVLALCLAVAWSLAPWRMAAMGLSGDETGYLAAARSLARDRDLELSNNGYAPWMLERAQYPVDAWGHEFPDNARDRLVGGTAQPAARRHELPVVAGPELAGEIGIVNTAATATEIVVRGNGAAEERFTLTPFASRLIAVPATTDWRGATVEASAPVAVAVRLATATGANDAYAGAPAEASFCIPVPALTDDSEVMLFLRNGDAAPVGLTVTRYGAAGQPAATESPTIPGNGALRLPLPEQTLPQAVCVAAERPVATIALARLGETGLLALPAPGATAGPLAIPPAPSTTHFTGKVALVAHNPGDAAVAVRRAGEATPLVTLPPRGTAQVAIDGVPAEVAGPIATLVADGPIVASFLLTLDRHLTMVAPKVGEGEAWFPAIVGDDRRFVATRVVLQNPGASPLAATVTLYDDHGEPRIAREVALCGGCAGTVRLDFTDDDGELIAANGAVAVRANGPVVATAEQLTVQSRSFQHEWGLPVLLIPGVRLGEWLGALLTVAACGALLIAQLYGLLRDAGIARRSALAAILALGLASPLLPFSLLLYPEIPAMLLLVTGLRLALGTIPLRGWRLGAAVACALAIPLLHTRLLPLAAVLAVCVAWRLTGLATLGRRAQGLILLAGVVPVAVIGLWWLARPLLPPVLALSSRLSAETLDRYFSTARIGHHLAGIAFDRATGLFAVAPLLLLAPAGLSALARHAPRYAFWPGLLVGAQFGIVALRAEGWEAWGPAGRYILPVVPLLVLGVASAWADWSPRWLRYPGAVLAVWGWALTAFLAWVPHAAYYFVPERKWFGDLLLAEWGWPNPLRLFPEIKAGWPFEVWAVVPWVVGVVVIVGVGVRWREVVKGK